MIGKRVRLFTCVKCLMWDCIWDQLLTLISKQNSPEEEAELKKLKDIEKSVEQMAKKLEKVDGELTGLKNVSICLYYKSWIFFQRRFVLFSNVRVPVFSGFLGKRPPGRGAGETRPQSENSSWAVHEDSGADRCSGNLLWFWYLFLNACFIHVSHIANPWPAFLLTECPRKFQWLQDEEKGTCKDSAGKPFFTVVKMWWFKITEKTELFY